MFCLTCLLLYRYPGPNELLEKDSDAALITNVYKISPAAPSRQKSRSAPPAQSHSNPVAKQPSHAPNRHFRRAPPATQTFTSPAHTNRTPGAATRISASYSSHQTGRAHSSYRDFDRTSLQSAQSQDSIYSQPYSRSGFRRSKSSLPYY